MCSGSAVARALRSRATRRSTRGGAMNRRGLLAHAFALMALPAAASAGTGGASDPASDSYASRLCDTPAKITGTVTLVGNISGPQDPSIAWDGAAYGLTFPSFSPAGL